MSHVLPIDTTVTVYFTAGVPTDITADVRSVFVRRGKSRWLDTARVGTAVFTVDNRSRDYDPLGAGAYSANVVPGRQVTIAASVPLTVLDLPGASGDYAHTPDSAAVSVTGDIDVRAHVALDDWTPAATTVLAAKWVGTGDLRSYAMQVNLTGKLVLSLSSDGAAFANAVSTVAPTVADGAALHVRVTLDVDNGASGWDAKFYTSVDGVVWSQLGSTVTTATATSIFDSTAALEVGAFNTGSSSMLSGTAYSAQVFDGIRPDEGTDFWLDLPGASGDYAHTPDSAAVSVTGDLDIRAHVAVDDWTPGGVLERTIVSKWDSSNASFIFRLATSGVLNFLWSEDGTTNINKASTVAPTVADGADLHVRVTLDVDAGSTDNDLTFYTSTDGVSWSQLGAVVNTAGVTSIFDGTGLLTLGANLNAGTAKPLPGSIYSAQVFDGIDGTLVADFNPTRDSSGYGDTSITSGTTGEVWTVAGNALVTGLVADFDPDRDAAAGASTVTSATTGEVWTVAGAASLIDEFNSVPVFDGTIDDWDLKYTIGGDATATAVSSDALADLGRRSLNEHVASSQLSGARVSAILDRAEVAFPAGTRAIDTGVEPLQADTVDAGTNVFDYLRLVTQTESGRLFASLDGTLTFLERSSIVPSAGIPTFNDTGTGIPYDTLEIEVGSEQLFNRASVTRLTGAEQIADNVASQTAYGIRTTNQAGLLFADDLAAESLAEYLVARYGDPAPRFARLGVNLAALGIAQANTTVGIELGDAVDVEFSPPGGGTPITETVIVEGIEHRIGVDRHDISLTMSATTGTPFVLDDIVFGVLDVAGTLAY